MKLVLTIITGLLLTAPVKSQELTIARISDCTFEIRVGDDQPQKSTMLVDLPREEKWRGPVAEAPRELLVGGLRLNIDPSPLTITVRRKDGTLVQRLAWRDNGTVAFQADAPVFGLGEGGGPMDRRGRVQSLADGYVSADSTSRVVSPVLIGANGWALFVPDLPDVRAKRSLSKAGLMGEFDLRGDQGVFRGPPNGQLQRFFLIGADQPSQILFELRRLMGGAPMPPRWALGYMQSHRTLAGWKEVLQIAREFREKQLPCDALIYLSEVYCKSGWGNGKAPFAWNNGNFPDPAKNLGQLHGLDFKVVLHATDYPATLHGESLAQTADGMEHIAHYWQQHLPIQEAGVDGWWADDGENLTSEGRLARQRMYYEGPLQTRPNERPWSLHRTLTPGAQRFGGWIWSGDPHTTWAALAAHVPSALNCGLSLTPFWGSDIGGFICTPELSAELYARWFEFGAFSPSFRAHGMNWHLRLPWGWNSGSPGSNEGGYVPKLEELHNAEIELICRKYLGLRYQLLPYNYTILREACDTGMPMMRALWLHYPEDPVAVAREDEYLWGRNLLVAPVVAKSATVRKLYLPRGQWFDWWSGERLEGGREITRPVDLATLPLFVRAGAIIPLDPVRQFTTQSVTEPTELRIYPGADGEFTLYDDDGHTLDYLKKDGSRIRLAWNEAAKELTLEPVNDNARSVRRSFRIRVMPENKPTIVEYRGTKLTLAVVPR